jgi:hypothetical protein
VYAQNFDFVDDRGFGSIRLWKNQALEVFPFCRDGDRQNAAYGLDRAVE